MCPLKHATRSAPHPLLVLLCVPLGAMAASSQQELDAGTQARARGDIYESVALLQQAIAQAPDQITRLRAMTQLGLSLEQAGRPADADGVLQRAYEQASGAMRISLALALGNVAAAEHDPARASRYYREVLDAADESAGLHAARLAAELNLARWQDARERLAALQQLYPRLASIEPVADRARAYFNLGALAGEAIAVRAADATAPEAQRSAAAEELAYRSWSTAAELAQQAGATGLQVECAEALAQLYERQGRWAEASQLNRSALALAQTLPRDVDEPETTFSSTGLTLRVKWAHVQADLAVGARLIRPSFVEQQHGSWQDHGIHAQVLAAL